ncbi:MAG: hypothetical protein LBQ24_01405 [Candidatus Peribacteria bacterium]|nr:hypothetical protein [Candidatus Peribacteria bacterium]
MSKEKTFIYKSVSKNEYDKAITDKQKALYMFKIEISDKKLLSKYFLALLSQGQDTFDLGKGEIFYRKVAIKPEDKKIKKGYENKKDKITRKNYIIENKRFTEEKFLLHLSIILNYKEGKKTKDELEKGINTELTKPENSKEICFL